MGPIIHGHRVNESMEMPAGIKWLEMQEQSSKRRVLFRRRRRRQAKQQANLLNRISSFKMTLTMFKERLTLLWISNGILVMAFQMESDRVGIGKGPGGSKQRQRPKLTHVER